MSKNIMAVILNGVPQMEYDRDKILANDQIQYLDKMDAKMAKGIPYDGDIVENPDVMRKSQFVAEQLYRSILEDKGAEAFAFASYLAMRVPELKQVKIVEKGEDGLPNIELIFDQEYKNQIEVSFEPKVTIN